MNLAEHGKLVNNLTTSPLAFLLQAFNGAEAVDIFKNHHAEVDLVILDVIMPKMNGIQAWDEIRDLCPGIKACFISGYTNEIMGGKIAIDTSLPFISKPVMPSTLMKKVREILDEISP